MLKSKSRNFLQFREFQLSVVNQSKASKRRKVCDKFLITVIPRKNLYFHLFRTQN